MPSRGISRAWWTGWMCDAPVLPFSPPWRITVKARMEGPKGGLSCSPRPTNGIKSDELLAADGRASISLSRPSHRLCPNRYVLARTACVNQICFLPPIARVSIYFHDFLMWTAVHVHGLLVSPLSQAAFPHHCILTFVQRPLLRSGGGALPLLLRASWRKQGKIK